MVRNRVVDPAQTSNFVDYCVRCNRGVYIGSVCTFCGRTSIEGVLKHSLCGRAFDDIEQFNEHVCSGRCPAMLDIPKPAGRPRKHVSDAERQRAYRLRKHRQRHR